MAFIHSIWTKPMIVNSRNMEFKKQLLVYVFTSATSAAYIKHFGLPINLYADGFGQDLLDFIPYDNVYNLKIPDNIPPQFWACGKFLALEKMQLGDIHIDGDVFLKKETLLNSICDNSYDFVVQSIEDDTETLMNYYLDVNKLCNLYNVKTNSCHFTEYAKSYNCGVIGFFNEELKHKYLTEYFNTLKSIMQTPTVLNEIINKKTYVPDLVLEQQFLYELSAEYKCHNILGDSTTMYENAISLGYQHILGEYKIKLLPEIINELNYIDPDLCKKALRTTKYIEDMSGYIK